MPFPCYSQLPYMPSVIRKKKGNQTYYYVATSGRVDGNSRIVKQTYLGTAQRLEKLVQDKAAPIPLEASALELGLPGALWQAARRCGAFDALLALWPKPRSGPAPAHYLLLAAIHRICAPGPKTTVADWYQHSILRSLWGFSPQRFRSQDFWDCFDRLDVSTSLTEAAADDLERAQSALLDAFRAKDLLSQRVLAYDTTNFHTWIASTNERCELPQRGRNKQKRHDLRQVGLSYALDGEHGLALCHHLYPGQLSDSAALPQALARIGRMLDRAQIPRETVTLVFDKGSAALANTLELQAHGLGWVSALPWHQAPPELRELPDGELAEVGPQQPGVRAAARTASVHGAEYLCVLQHSSAFAAEQLHSTAAALTKATQQLRRLAREVAKPQARYTERGLQRRLQRYLAADFVAQLLSCELAAEASGWRIRFQLDPDGLQRLLAERFGRTVLVTNRRDWTAAQVAQAYSGQQHVERVFRGLKGGNWLGWGPMHHWTDDKIRVHAFSCLLGVSLLQHVRQRAAQAWPGLSMEELKQQLGGIQQVELLYPRQGQKGPPRVVSIASKQTLVQQALVKALDLEELIGSLSKPRG